jgi:hypothetical protein
MRYDAELNADPIMRCRGFADASTPSFVLKLST